MMFGHYWRHCTTLTTLLVSSCAILITIVPPVTSSGVFEFRFFSFINELNRDASGNCCNGYRTEIDNNNNNDAKNELCSDKCQTFFRVCLKHYQTNIDPSPPCTFGEVITDVFHNSSVIFADNDNTNGLTNPIQFPFNFSWPETFSLIVEAWHKHEASSSSSSSSSKGVSSSRTRTLITRLAVSRFLKVDSKWTHKVYTTNHSSLTYSYRVTCNEHYYGEHCGDLCKPRDDKYGHFTCGSVGEKICHSGWRGNYCEKAICRSGCNETYGECSNPNECLCRRGWEGPNCDRCTKYPNCLHGYCHKPWDCICKEGWGGLLCNQDLNYCTNHKPCKNGGSCTNTGQGWYTCECPPGFTGQNCDSDVDSCSQLPCVNGGTCKSLTATNYTCECPLGFFGRHCETMASACTNNPCNNGGTCIDGPSGYMCICKLGYKGDTCEVKQTDCDPNPCSNGGSCATTDEDSYRCFCRAGFEGDNCEVNINDCDENRCLNSGTCVDEVNSFRCLCVPGFIGSLCQDNVDDCLTKPCANGGTCSDMANDYQCACAPGFAGKDCSININECEPNPCLNGALCDDRVNEYVCQCTPGFFGNRCEYSDFNNNNDNNVRIIYDVSRSFDNVNTTMTAAISTDSAEPLSSQQIVLIVLVSAIVPFTVLVAVVIIYVCKHRKHKLEHMRQKDELEARRQNEQNHNASMNNKCLDHSGANVIVNALDRPPLYHLNRQKSATLSKLTNEDNDARNFASIDKSATLQRTKSNNKLLNTECAAKMQHKLHRPISKLIIENMPKDRVLNINNSMERRDSVSHLQSVPNSIAKSESSMNNSTLAINRPMERDVTSHNNIQSNNNFNNNVATLRHERSSGRSNNSIYVIDDHYSQTPYIRERLYATEV